MKPVLYLAKPDKNTTEKKSYKSIYLINIDVKILNNTLAKSLQIKFDNTSKSICHYHFAFMSGMQRWFNICKLINVIQYMNRIKEKNHII
jgi:hypothetical protein